MPHAAAGMSTSEGAEQTGAEDESLRAFVGVAPGSALRAALAQVREALASADFGDGLRWVPAENLHLTLRFLGEVPRASLPALISALRDGLGEQACFELPLEGIALFPSARRPRALVAALPGARRLEELAAAVEAAVREGGLPPERRRFRPHITLARVRRGQRAGELPGIPFEAPHLAVNRVTLYRSVLASSGARYSSLEDIALGESTAS